MADEIVPYTPPGVEDAATFHAHGVDPLTGIEKEKEKKNWKLTTEAIDFLCWRIVLGDKNRIIAEKLVSEGYISYYTDAAVAYWRKSARVAELMRHRTTEASMAGLASRDKRLSALNAMTEALIREDFTIHADGSMTFLKEEVVGSQAAQATRIKEIRENIRAITDLIGDADPKRALLDVNIVTSREKIVVGLEGKTDAQRDQILREAIASLGPSAMPVIEAELVSE